MKSSIWIRRFYPKKKVECWQKLPSGWSCCRAKCSDHLVRCRSRWPLYLSLALCIDQHHINRETGTSKYYWSSGFCRIGRIFLPWRFLWMWLNSGQSTAGLIFSQPRQRVYTKQVLKQILKYCIIPAIDFIELTPLWWGLVAPKMPQSHAALQL